MARVELPFGTSYQSLLELTTQIVRVCISYKAPINPNLPFTNKSNLQVKFGSKAMASLHDLL